MNVTTRFYRGFTMAIALVTFLPGHRAMAGVEQPNVVIILADDLGYGDIGCYGAQLIKTPNIDGLAEKGMRCMNAYAVAPVCCPSRYAMMTGTYPWRIPRHEDQQLWATHVSPSLIKKGQPTLASVFKSAGYATGIVGKWHLGLMNSERDWNKKLSPGPLECGFDYFFGDASNRYWFYIENHHVVGLDPDFPIQEKGGKLVIPPSVMRINNQENARVLNDKACEFIVRHSGKNPFFLYYAPNNIHVQLTPGTRFQGSSKAGVYGDFVQELDGSVGEIVKALDASGELENTLIIFTSDNGGYINRESRRAGHLTNGSLLGQKTDVWEGGVHVGFIAHWPGVVPAGSTSDALICLTDLPATAAQIVKADLPNGSFPDGLSLLPVLRDEGRLPENRSVVFNWGNRAKTFGIRQGDWVYLDRQGSGGIGAGDEFTQPHRDDTTTYAECGFQNSDIHPDGTIRSGAPSAQLYNLDSDPSQKVNVIESHPEKSKAMAQLLEKIQKKQIGETP